MKKFLSFFAAILFAGSLLADVGSVYYSFVPYKPSSGAVSDYTQTGTMTIDGLDWTVPGNWYGNAALRLGGKSLDAVDRSIIGKASIGDAIAKIVITHKGVTSDKIVLNSVKLTVASDDAFSADVETVTLTAGEDFTVGKNTDGTIEITPAGDFWAKDSYYKFDFNFTNSNSSNYAFVLSQIDFYSYEAAGTVSIEASVDEIDFGTVLQKEGSISKTFTLTGKNLTGNVRLSALGAIFSVYPTVITPTDGVINQEITVYAQTGWTGTQDNVINVESQAEPADFELKKLLDVKMTVKEVPALVKISGSWDEWAAESEMELDAEGETASFTTNLEVGTYDFFLAMNAAYYLAAADITRANSAQVCAVGSGNSHIVADEAGEYTFTWTYATNTLTVTYPAKTIPGDFEAVFAYNGKGTTSAEEVTYEGGTLTGYGYGQPGPEDMNTNMMYNSAQKGNMTIKIGKGYHKNTEGEPYYFMGITLDKALEEGDLLQIAAFRTGATDCVFGMDFNAEADSATATADCQYLFENNLQILSSNGTPEDVVIDIPACAVGSKFIRLYRFSGSTGLYIANFSVYRAKSVEPEKQYELKNCWDGGEWKWKATVKDGDDYKLENVVFGGQGVNWRETTDPGDGSWISVDEFLGDKIGALDTVTLVFKPATPSITATLIGKYIAPADPDYTVAGSSTLLFGSAWNEANTDNDMEKQLDGTYKWEKTDLVLAAGTIEFKVCENHSWNPSYPNDNYVLNIPEGAIYTVTITFNPDSKEVAAVATKTGEAVVLPTIVLHGNFTGNWEDTEEFTPDGEKKNATLTLNLGVGAYEFGFKFDGAWKANGANITRAENTTNLSAGSGNMHITADKAGDYVFTYTYDTQALVVTYPVATGIEETLAEGKAVKVVRDGQVLILKADSTFNVMGQRVK